MAKKKAHKAAHLSFNPDALRQAEQEAARRRLEEKIPSWAAVEGLQCPPGVSLEQCSSEATAQHKAAVVRRLVPEGGVMADLTGGYGVDFAFLAPHFRRALYFEQQEPVFAAASHNFPLLGLTNVEAHCCNSVEAFDQLPPLDLLYLDPARRPTQAAQRLSRACGFRSGDKEVKEIKEVRENKDFKGGRAVLIEDCEPNVAALLPQLLAKARTVMVKLAPMLDISRAVATLQHHVTEVHVVATRGECKELLLVLTADETVEPELHVVDCEDRETKEIRENKEAKEIKETEETKEIKDSEKVETAAREIIVPLSAERESVAPIATAVGQYLYEPSVGLLKAGLFKWTAAHYGLRKLHPNTHLYTAAHLVPDFPGRTFRVLGVHTFSKPSLRALCAAASQNESSASQANSHTLQTKSAAPRANLAVRNFPDTVASLRRRLKLLDGGPAYWFATTLADNSHVIIDTRKVGT